MRTCLEDQTLLSLYGGEGTGAERTHLAECHACAERYRRLGRDLETITQALRGEPPETVGRSLSPFAARWVPAAAVLALALTLVWVGVEIWSPSDLPIKETTADVRSFGGGFPSDLFLLNEAIAEELATGQSDFADLFAVLEREWPAEWYEPSANAEVEILID
jgi:hypothetical protein